MESPLWLLTTGLFVGYGYNPIATPLTASTSLQDQHCAFHCESKRPADSVLHAGSDTFSNREISFFFFKAPNGKGCTRRLICCFYFVAGCEFMRREPGLMTRWRTPPMRPGWLNVNKQYRGQHLIGDTRYPPICGEMSTGQSGCLPSDTSLMGLVAQIAEQDEHGFPW